MPLFRYVAVTPTGKPLKGVIDADSLLVAKERLRKEQVLVTSICILHTKHNQITLTPPLLLSFTRELAQLLKAGLPLYESLLTIEEKYRKHKAHPLFLDLCDHLKEGLALSVALKKYGATFSHIYLSMVQVAEESGRLAEVFDELAQLIARQQKLKKQFFSALAYPLFLALFCLFVFSGLLFFVIPSMKELFEDRALHPVTATVLAISNWATTHVSFLVTFISTVLIGAIFSFRHKKGKYFIYQACLKVPLLKTFILHSALVRFCRALAMLLKSNVPLLEALNLSQNVLKSPLLEKAVSDAQKKITQGERLSSALRASPLIPSLVIRMLSLAEETGKMGEAFFNLSEIYDEELQKHLSQLCAILQPALLITLGAVVGLVVLSILLPLTDMGSFSN